VLQGELVTLRARWAADVPVLQAELHDDVATHIRADSRPWRPISPGSEASPYAVSNVRDDAAAFSVVELATGKLAGEAVLWGINTHHRNAHIGIALVSDCRGRGLGLDTVRVLCHYGFAILGLHRLQLETATDNEAMRRTAGQAGFSLEGVQREAFWTDGRFVDDAIFGLLAADRPAP